MPVPFGFSVGDCISICLLIKDTIKALDSARGSASEYQALIKELWALDKALLEVVRLQESVRRGCGHTKELNALFVTVGSAVQQCKGSIEGLLKTIKRYERSLGSGQGNGGGLWNDVRGKVSWALLRKDDLNRFRTEVNAHSSAINMLLITASVSLSKLNSENIQEGTNQQLGILGQVKDTLAEQRSILERNSTAFSRLADSVRYFFTLGAELKELMARICTLSFRSYDILLELQTRVPREFEPCWIQEPLLLTDALGRIAPVHLELINSWAVLESVLEARFHNIPGERKIRRKEYALQDRSSQLDIQRSASFNSCFLPGIKVDMSMVFKQGHSGAYCPGCGKEGRQGPTVTSQCESCGIWFQRIEELIECDIEESIVEPAPARVKSKPIIPSQFAPQHSNLKTPKLKTTPIKRSADATDLDEHISLFKRVRLLQPKYVEPKGLRASSEQTQRISSRSFVTSERQRVFSWLEDNRRWEKDQETKRQQKLPTYLLKTKSFLQLAAYNGDMEAVRGFLSQGEDVNTISVLPTDKKYRRYRCTALTAAVERYHTSLVEYLLAAGSDPNVSIEHGDTPLVLAVQNRSLEIADILLRNGANVNQMSPYQTVDALQRACYDGNLDMVDLLLSYGADANGPIGNFGFGPALVAAAANDNVGIIDRLIASGADVNRFQYYIDPSLRRRQNALVRAISNDSIPTVHRLLDSGADFNMECECGDALQNAAYFGREEIFDELVVRGANPYRETKFFANSLEAAAAGGQGRMFKKLLALGMDTNIKSAKLDNLLQVASRSGENSIVEYLLDQGMDVNLQGGFYGTALIAAACHGNESTCRILIDRGADLLIQNHDHDHKCALHYAVAWSLPDVVRLLLDAGTPVNMISGEYGTVLQLAAQNTSEDVVHLLLDCGADVNIQAGYFGNALQAWSYIGNKEITELLLSKGANPNNRGGFYETALIAAVHGGHEDVVELLIRAGAEVGMDTSSFGSALDCASFLMRQSSKWDEGEMYGRIIQLLTYYEHDLRLSA